MFNIKWEVSKVCSGEISVKQIRKHDSVFGSFKKPLSLKQREQVEGYRFDSYYDKFNH